MSSSVGIRWRGGRGLLLRSEWMEGLGGHEAAREKRRRGARGNSQRAVAGTNTFKYLFQKVKD